ncbi:hypothetical protein H5410_019745 [Solanum commersonii]|uniref:Endonuclease/exonuclease/phosphatase domain-containing protein n=1 Tax=Solanum commersonii TaxID=4109 RepID=A0A9J5Z973_SOLCO|nr:hypothetical protein H5410_019745 [Solanum commersonii]
MGLPFEEERRRINNLIDDFVNRLKKIQNEEEEFIASKLDNVEKLTMDLRFLRTFVLFGDSSLDEFYDKMSVNILMFESLAGSVFNEDESSIAKYNMVSVTDCLVDEMIEIEKMFEYLFRHLNDLPKYHSYLLLPLMSDYNILQQVFRHLGDFYPILVANKTTTQYLYPCYQFIVDRVKQFCFERWTFLIEEICQCPYKLGIKFYTYATTGVNPTKKRAVPWSTHHRWDHPTGGIPPLTMKDKHKPPHTEPAMIQYGSLLKSKTITPTVVAAKPVIMLHGEPSITWKASKVRSLIIKENLQYVIIGKFSYGKPDVTELRKTTPGQCSIKRNATYKAMPNITVGQFTLNYEAKREDGQQGEGKEDLQNMIGTATDQRKTLTSGKVVGNKQNRQEWMVRRRNKYKRDKYGYIEAEVDYQDENTFEALREDQDKDTMEKMTDNKEGKSTKEWVENTFEHKENEDMLKGEEEAMTKQNEGAKYETDKEVALVIAKINDEKVIPLAMQMDNDGGDKQEIEEFSKRLGMKHVVANANGKIWAFIDEILDSEMIRDKDHMLTIKLQNQGLGIEVMVSLVYAKCTQRERLQLWESMYELSCSSRIPWVVGGLDFNVITNDEEKLGGRPVTESEVRDFNHCISVCNLEDKGFKGSKYTWWNGRTYDACIFKRLDRIFCNDQLQNIFPVLKVEQLTRSGSDHTPLSITFKTTNEKVYKPFRFLNLWLREESFIEVVRNHWSVDFAGDPLVCFTIN